MATDERITYFKYRVLQHAYKHKNVTSTCKAFNLYRTTFYERLNRFNKFGYLGLKDKQRFEPRVSNQIPPKYQDNHLQLHNRVPDSWTQKSL